MDLGKKIKIEGEKVLIVGNRSYKNLGDELILLGTINLLLEQGKTVYVAAYNINWLKSFLKQFIDVEKIIFLREIPKGFRSFFKFIRHSKGNTIKKYKEVDSVIIGGGEILTEEVPSTYRYWLISIFPCIKKRANVYLMGGIQIPKKWYNKKLFSYLLKKTQHIYARDLESVYELKKYGFENAEFFMDTSYFAIEWDKLKNLNKNKAKKVIININKNGASFLDDIIKDIKYYNENKYEILYVPMAKGKNQDYSDIYYYQKIKKKLDFDINVKILDWEENFVKFIKEIVDAEIVISTRLHLFLISNFLGTRTKVYPYQKKILKMKEVIRNIGLNNEI